MPIYSVAISPPEAVISQVADMKQQLKNKIGFYQSCNSLAHITINGFIGNEATLQRWQRYLTDFTANCTPMTLCFNRTGYFGNGAFFLAPDDESKVGLVGMMKRFHAGFPAAAFGKSTVPHISIGRQLNDDQLAVAKDLITNVDLSFVCDNLVIRKLNEDRGQYDIYKRFDFSGKDLFSEVIE